MKNGWLYKMEKIEKKKTDVVLWTEYDNEGQQLFSILCFF